MKFSYKFGESLKLSPSNQSNTLIEKQNNLQVHHKSDSQPLRLHPVPLTSKQSPFLKCILIPQKTIGMEKLYRDLFKETLKEKFIK